MSKIRTLRKRQGLTLEDLSGVTGISVSYLSRIEAGSRRLNSDTLGRISTSLGCHPADLLDDVIPRREDGMGRNSSYGSSSWMGGHDAPPSQLDQTMAQFYPMIASMNNDSRAALLRHALTLSIAQIGGTIGYGNSTDNVARLSESSSDAYGSNNSENVSPLTVLQELPVYRQSSIDSGDETTIDFTKPIRWVNRPAELIGVSTAFALEVFDNALAPKYRAGDLILVNPNRTVSPGCSSIILKKNNHVLVKEYVQTVDDKVFLREFTAGLDEQGTNQLEVQNNELQSMYRIIGSIETAA